MTAHIMMWHFLESILLPSAEKKKVKQETVPHTHHDQEFVTFLEHDLLPLTEKKVMLELLP